MKNLIKSKGRAICHQFDMVIDDRKLAIYTKTNAVAVDSIRSHSKTMAKNSYGNNGSKVSMKTSFANTLRTSSYQKGNALGSGLVLTARASMQNGFNENGNSLLNLNLTSCNSVSSSSKSRSRAESNLVSGESILSTENCGKNYKNSTVKTCYGEP